MPIEPSQPGRRPCIQCGKTFRSPDVMRVRRCKGCKTKERGLSGIRIVRDGGGDDRGHTPAD